MEIPARGDGTHEWRSLTLLHKIENSTGAERVAHINDLMLLYDQSREHFPSKYDEGEVLVDKANLAYKYKKELAKSDEQFMKFVSTIVQKIFK